MILSKLARVFAASLLILFVSSVRGNLALAQEQPQETSGQNHEQESVLDRNDGAAQEAESTLETQEGPQDEVAEMDGAHDDGALHDADLDQERVEDQKNDQTPDVLPAPPVS
jgi:hypothetical protein